MRKLLTIILTTLALYTNAKIVYVDNHDAMVSPSYQSSPLYLDIDKDGSNDIYFNIVRTNINCQVPGKGGWYSNYEYFCETSPSSITGGNRILKKTDCKNDTLNYLDNFSTDNLLITRGTFPDLICSGNGVGSYKLGFRLTKKNTTNNVNGFIYGYVDYSLTASGDIVVHGWYYNDTFNESIIANSKTPYPYNGCIYQDTIKTYVKVNVYDTIKVPKTIYDTVKITQVEIVKKTIYDTIKIEKIINKTICDSTIFVTINDTITKTINDTILHHVIVNDTVTKIIYNTVKLTIYDTVPVPIAVHDTLIIELGKKSGQRLRLWPNPANQTITLDLSNTNPTNVLIIDQSGKILADFNITTQITTLDTGQWAQGTYTVTATQGSESTTKHIQINR